MKLATTRKSAKPAAAMPARRALACGASAARLGRCANRVSTPAASPAAAAVTRLAVQTVLGLEAEDGPYPDGLSRRDRALLAKAFGARHYRVAEAADLDALFANADLERGFNLIEILLDKQAFPRYLTTR